MTETESVRREPADFPQMIRQLIMVCNTINIEGDPVKYKEAVRDLENTLAGYWDASYKEQKEALDKIPPITAEELIEDKAKRHRLHSYQKNDLTRQANYSLAIRLEHKRFEELIKLVTRLNMFLEREIEEEI
jgi:hypothetical protein